MSNKIPTAEKFFEQGGTYPNLAIAFAKLHVKAAAKNVRTTCLADKFLDAYDPSKDAEGDVFTKDSILNAYPENLIQ